MTDNTLYIKNMVCNRCILFVDKLLNDCGCHPLHVELGKAILEQAPDADTLSEIRNRLEAVGFELIDDKRARLIETVKRLIIQLVREPERTLKTNLSVYLSEACRTDYSTLSKLFSESCGVTIEKYFIAQKIERTKELLAYGELSLNEIADQLDYSSTAHLSAQFKSLTGITPSQFKKQQEKIRKPLDEVI